MDGASRFGAFLYVALPLAAPGLAATAIFTLLNAWDEFFFALVFTSLCLEDCASGAGGVHRAPQRELGDAGHRRLHRQPAADHPLAGVLSLRGGRAFGRKSEGVSAWRDCVGPGPGPVPRDCVGAGP